VPRFSATELPEGPRVPAGRHIELLFRNREELAAATDADLLERDVSPAPHAVFEHVNRLADDDWQTVEAALAGRDRIASPANPDGHSAALGAQLGRRPP